MEFILRYVVYIFPALTIFGIILFFTWYAKTVWFEKKALYYTVTDLKDMPEICGDTAFTFCARRHPMSRRDILPLLLLTVIYAAIAFWQLGDMCAPQTFLRLNREQPSVTVNLGEKLPVARVSYYTGLWSGEYNLEFSEDGDDFQFRAQMEQSHARLFNWLTAPISEADISPPKNIQYVRISAASNVLELGEIVLYDYEGRIIPADKFSFDRQDGTLLFDEQNLVPERAGYMNSAYFDEIYHGRTAYEHMRNIYPYEISHPPLGKLIIMQGVKLFGMTPFGYRFMGTLFGVLMLPVFYILLKNMFGKTELAFLGTALFAFDFMHFVQTRIATIDVYGVFFIILMYLFMFRYITSDYEKPVQYEFIELFFCGLFFGLGAAAKWISIYAGIGLLALYIINLVLRAKYYKQRQKSGEFAAYAAVTVIWSVIFFIVIPAVVYCASYYPYWTARGFPPTLQNILSTVWENQKYMFNYHEGVDDPHPYSSRWWLWLINARPILYFLDYPAENIKSSFGAFNNPLISWGGLVSMVFLCFRIKGNRHKALIWFIIIGYLSQMLPWVLITRVTFAYHYFPSLIFLVLAICFVFYEITLKKPDNYRQSIYIFTLASVVLFIMFYPVLSGKPAPEWYFAHFLRWFSSWPF